MRFRVAVVFALTLILNAAPVRAQDAQFTVTVSSADVYKGPTNVTPVIGHVARGTTLPVSRNLGSWVKVPWPDGPDGFGYVHVTMGRLSPADAATSAAPSSRASATRTNPATAGQVRPPAGDQIAPRRQVIATPASHVLGVGAFVAPTTSFGATVRGWRANRLGVQVGFTRDALTSDVAPGRMTSFDFEPGVVYGLFDRVGDYVWFRPYVGSALSVRHQTLNVASVETGSNTDVGWRFFGGAEMTFASAPRVGLSVDVGYRRSTTPFVGFDERPVSVAIAGHWYVR